MRLKSKVVTACLVSALLFSCFAVFTVQPVSAQGVTWSYNASTNTATASGAGSTNFAALVAADTAGGWGKFTADATGTQIRCAGTIEVGDGSTATVLTDTSKQVYWSARGTPYYVLRVNTNSSMILGNPAGQKDGVQVFVNNAGNHIINNGGTINCYASTFKATANWKLIGFNIMENCLVDGFDLTPDGKGISQQNINVLNAPSDGVRNPSGVSDNVVILNSRKYGVTFYTASVNEATVVNLNIENAATASFQINSASNCNFYLTNPVVDSWTIVWVGTTTNTKLYRQYEFDLTVLNGEITEFVNEANVTLTKGGVVVGSWLTNSSGQIDSQVLTYGYYQQTTGNTLQGGADPFVLTVTHPDWADYTSRFYVTEKTKMTISMQEVSGASESEIDEWFVVGGIVGCVFAAVVVGALLLARKND